MIYHTQEKHPCFLLPNGSHVFKGSSAEDILWVSLENASSEVRSDDARLKKVFSHSTCPLPYSSFSSKLLSIHSLPSLYLCLGFPQPRCRALHLTLLNLLRFSQTYLSSLPRDLWRASLPSTISMSLQVLC